MLYIFLKNAFFLLLFSSFFLFISLFFAIPMLTEGKILGNIFFVLFFIYIAYLVAYDLPEIYRKSKNKYTRKIHTENINNYVFPPALKQNIKAHYLHLEDEQIDGVLYALKRYFLFYIERSEKDISGKTLLKDRPYETCFISDEEKGIMPSIAVDFAWKTFSKMNEHYTRFCSTVLGCHLDYSLTCPANTAINTQKLIYWHSYENDDATEIFTNTWLMSCKAENIDPVFPARLPLLFSLDQRLNIPSGLCYTFNDRPYTDSIDIRDAPTPDMLSEEIRLRLSPVKGHCIETNKSKQLDYLSKKLSFYLNHYEYCHLFQKKDITSLFNTIFDNSELVTHLFGDYTLLEEQQEITESQAATPPPADDIGCCCSGSAV